MRSSRVVFQISCVSKFKIQFSWRFPNVKIYSATTPSQIYKHVETHFNFFLLQDFCMQNIIAVFHIYHVFVVALHQVI